MEKKLKEKRAIVTGGAKGIGKAIGIALEEAGARVWVIDKDQEALDHLRQHYPRMHTSCLDLADAEEVINFFSNLDEAWPKIDILVNNAGLSRFIRLTEISIEEWDYILNSNLRAAFVCAREFAKRHQRGSYGRIIQIASTRHLMSEPGGEAYSASKGGLVSLTHALANSLSGTGITANCISPGWIHTDETEVLRAHDHSQHLSGRVGKPSDIASLVIWLCHPENDFVNAENIYVDGGMTRKMIYEP
ncbi:SDR family NAD(P)-dependent oxidoreductase [Thermophagus sp. OGC60D27]|uniref:SDR family NAD(P)-dependent oxidoreductase n=1 Tax=Thermophagus sp. OGC60D27 TaxID=3458415 RepID=UPI004037718A